MAFRFFLVSAVATLGVDLPTGSDMQSWVRSGQAWWSARVAEFEARHGDADERQGTPCSRPEMAEAKAPDNDAAFAAVIEEVVASFADDSVQSQDGTMEAEASQLVAGVDDASFGPALADALNRWGDGLSEPAEPAPSARVADVVSLDRDVPTETETESKTAGPRPASDIAPAISPGSGPVARSEALDPAAIDPTAVASTVETIGASPVDGLSHGDRLSDAVRLTGQALHAWLTVLHHGGPSVSSSR